MKVLLLSMPFGALKRPNIRISLIKGKLNRSAIGCDVHYLNERMAELVGYADYDWICSELPYSALAGDWIFLASLYGENPATDQSYIDNVLKNDWHFDDFSIARLMRIRLLADYFLNYCLETIPWEEYSIIGFISSYEQNIASLALAKQIKATHPHITIVFSCDSHEGESGMEIEKNYHFVDYFCPGNISGSFHKLVCSLHEIGLPDGGNHSHANIGGNP